jgi:photosystem II stability/assembly factor-like uncharacterized protein
MALRKTLLVLLLGALLAPWSLSYANRYDVLELPAVPSEKAIHAPLFFVGKFGDRFFAAGQMGHILFSDDGGETWTQAEVPVRSTVLDVFFINEQLGWAVGHEGVILHSSDGGKTWEKQFDGNRYGDEGLIYYTGLVEENPDNELYPYMVEEMEFAISQGADKPLFRVVFHDENYGHAVGAYGMALVTRDGGKNWVHNLETYENDNFNHVFDFAVLPESGRFFLIGEAGLLMVGDANLEVATRLETVPWEGSFFTGATAADGSIVMGGLRGRMFRTRDQGATWETVEKPPTSAIVASTRLADGRLVFGGAAGEVLVSTDDGASFSMSAASGKVERIFDLTEGDGGTLLLAGLQGIKSVTLAPK